jgi:hypothetical protein
MAAALIFVHQYLCATTVHLSREAFILFIQSLYLLLLIYRLTVVPPDGPPWVKMRASLSIGIMAAYVAAVYMGVCVCVVCVCVLACCGYSVTF